ncbi:MAG: response regulator [Chroococcidiopsidaceae cyanobacterium CP_BM_RX_35]|nr:response regulator [Chroococcidiopsidaceae cyanobacterium CP_BM_RX_35]
MKKKILVIEDEARTRHLYLKCLEAEGFCAIGAENGLIGIHRAQEQLPDLVVCDIVMPKLDGYGVLSELRQNPSSAIIPFIFLTAKVSKAERRQGMKLGADDYISKPCTVEELLGAITAQLQKQAAIKQWYAANFQKSQLPSADTEASLATPQSIFPSISQLSEVFNFIEANYHQSITISDVAQAVGYSPAYLTNSVGNQTGKTLHCWIIERRMAEARSLLLETKQPVKQIAARVGYQNACHFSRHFRQLHGITPQDWRRTHAASSA